MQLINSLKEIFKTGADSLKGQDQSIFMAKIVKELGKGGQRLAVPSFGWNRATIRKVPSELDRS
jgi:hypothetical protein